MKNQCNDSEIRDMASEAKSLLRVSESVEHIRQRLSYEQNHFRGNEEDRDVLKTYTRDGYLDGLLLLDKKGAVVAQYDKSGLGSRNVLHMVDIRTLMDPMIFAEKTYTIRIETKEGGHIDLASAARSDDKFIISNDKKLEGTRIEDTEILQKIMERGTGKKLIHAKDRSSTFGHHFGLMEKSKDYYVYAFMDEGKVFRTTFPNVMSIMFLYVLLLIVADMLLRKAETTYQNNQLTSQKAYTENLEAALEQAKKANAAKSSFLSRMSHDMRTPLNGIIGLIKIDEDHMDDTALVKENHQKMRISANHLLSLINDVLQMGKLEDGNSVLTHEVISLTELTQDIVTIIIGRDVEAGIEWDYEKGKTNIPYPYIYGSPVHLRQIFLNIYGTCTYRWTITDTGIGMGKEFLDHVFDPFTQEKNDARSTYQGIGLGMTIVKRLIDQMGGTIRVDSEEGVGSTFVITIPFEIAPEPAPIKASSTEEADISGIKIMLVDDNELNAEIGETLLTDQGAEVTTVSDGKQAVDLFMLQPKGTFDVILMDVMMPVMDGLTATRMIRALSREDAKQIPIIAMTANAFKSDEEKCLAAGMNAHLAKPLDIDLLKKTIREQIGGSL